MQHLRKERHLTVEKSAARGKPLPALSDRPLKGIHIDKYIIFQNANTSKTLLYIFLLISVLRKTGILYESEHNPLNTSFIHYHPKLHH